ncbi:MAG TPA: acetyl-CoA hydrolase/transferase C-terminal domain-containing protein [Pantanalinema sp.]
MHLEADWKQRAVTPAEAIACVRSGMNVFLHGAAASPLSLEEALCAREDLSSVKLYHIHKNGPALFTDPSHSERFRSFSLFAGANVRAAIDEGRADFVPIFLSDIPWLFESAQVPLDVAVVQLSYPDAHGYCSLGTSVDTAKAAVASARIVVAEINRRMPRTHGNSFVHLSEVDAFVLTDRPLAGHEPAVIGPVERAIGEEIASVIEDGSTLQLGIGAIPDAVLAALKNKHELGIHSEMFSDGVVDLVEAGVITNRLKAVHPGRLVTSFVNGSQRLFDFVDDNPAVEFHPCDYTNDTALIRRHDKMIAINSAIEIDLTGQVCADSMGTRIYSGIGGQMDFIRGAALSRGGKPIIALPSTAKKGTVSRIAATLKPGAGVVTTRGHVHWVATEYGMVNLHGLSLRERGEALVSIAHPDFRAELKATLKERRLVDMAVRG